jgi:hypothetical protein
MRWLVGAALVLAACSSANAAGPTTSDVLRAERGLAATLRSDGKVGYPDFEKADTGEQPQAISNLKCRDGDCTYDLVVASKAGSRIIHRPSVHFCQDPQNAWVQCVP